MVGGTQFREELSGCLVRTDCFAVPGIVTVLIVVGGFGELGGGWLWAPSVAVAAMAALGWWGWGRGGGRLVASVTGALSELALAPWSAQEAQLSHRRLRAAMNSIPVPANFEHTDDLPGGSGMCFDECPVHTRQWLAAGDEETVRAQLRELFEGRASSSGSGAPTDQLWAPPPPRATGAP